MGACRSLTIVSSTESTDTADAAERLTSLLAYVEQVVRLDEHPAMRLAEYKLPTGQAFVIQQHELVSLPGISHDLTDDDGSIWLKIERLRRGAPPLPPAEIAPWLEVSPNPDQKPVLRTFVITTVSDDQRLSLVEAGAARDEDCARSTLTAPTGAPQWDVRLRLEDRPEIENDAQQWIESSWLPWAIAERPVRKTLSLYQRFFEVAQLAEMGGGDKPFGLRPVETGGLHHRVHGAPAGHARPGPQPLATAFAAAGLALADAMHQVERVEQSRGDGYGTIDAGPALFQALDHQHAGGEVHAIDGEGESLGEPAAGIGDGHAEGAHLAIGALGRAQESVAFAGGEVFPRAVRGVQLHAGLRGRGGGFRGKDAGSRADAALAGAQGQRPRPCLALGRPHHAGWS